MAANAISPSEIESWARQRLISLSPYEFDLILMLDRIKRSVIAMDKAKRDAYKKLNSNR